MFVILFMRLIWSSEPSVLYCTTLYLLHSISHILCMGTVLYVCLVQVWMGNMVCEWMLEQGGLVELEKLAIRRSNMLYDLIDGSNGFYNTFVTDPDLRSRMQVVFTIGTGEGKDAKVCLLMRMLYSRLHMHMESESH